MNHKAELEAITNFFLSNIVFVGTFYQETEMKEKQMILITMTQWTGIFRNDSFETHQSLAFPKKQEIWALV